MAGSEAALDITVTSAEAEVAAGGDPADSAYGPKRTKYEGNFANLNDAGISFIPMVWTSEGRPHPAAMRVLNYASNLIDRKRGYRAKLFCREWRHAITVEVVKRQVAMIRAVNPKASSEDMRLMWGRGTEDH